MVQKQNNQNHYCVKDHAIEMFRKDAKFFSIMHEEFDILPFSESYYNCNRDCFIHKDRMEIYSLVIELTKLGYLEKTGDEYNIVTITDNGHLFLDNWNSIQERYSKRGI